MTVTSDMAPTLSGLNVRVEDWGAMMAAVDWIADGETEITGSEVSVATDGGTPATISGTTFHVAPDHTYVVTVRVRDSGGHWSAPESIEYTP